MENDKICTLIINGDKKVQPSPMDIQKKIESASSLYMQKKDPKKLVEAMEELLLFMVNGNAYPRLLMTIIRFVITCDDHRVKKLCQIYWEICEKVRENGELKEEMVLVCNAIRNDLIHSNEYIRGRTLRLLCRMRYFKIMEPLVESVLKNLSHRHAYVRRNAVTCVYSIVKTFGPDVIPQASVEIEQLLLVEGDLSTKRIAFIMLLNCDIDRAIAYAISVEEQVTSLGDVFQLALLELVRKVAKTRPGQKARLMKMVFYLANASSPAVMFECAQILSTLAASPSATQIAASSYVNLINSQPDNNVKLIVLDHLEGMDRHVVEALVMDILRGLSCPAIGVRRKIIAIATRVLTSRNVSDVVGLLRKEITKTLAPENDGNASNTEYRRLLIETLQDACRQFPEFAETVLITLTDLLRDKRTEQATGLEIILFLRELVVTTTGLQKILVDTLCLMLSDLSRSRVLRMALWLIGEYTAPGDAGVAVERVLKSIGPLPIRVGGLVDADVDKEETSTVKPTEPVAEEQTVLSTRTIVLADGTYASQAVYSAGGSKSGSSLAGLRNLLVGGDILLASLTGVVIAKLCIRGNLSMSNSTLFALTCLVRIVKESLPFGGKEHVARLMHCLRVVAEPGNAKLRALCLKEWSSVACREALTKVVASDTALRVKKQLDTKNVKAEPANLNVGFRVLKAKRDLLAESDPSLVALDLQHGHSDEPESTIPGVMSVSKKSVHVFSNRLSKAVPMTGLADAVYIEGYLRLNGYDLILELAIVNRTSDTLQNILVELCAHGDLKVVEKPAAVTLGPGESQTAYATIKVSSTENGVLFGYATYDKKSALDKEWMVLNEVRADVLDYMQPNCSVSESEFKAMWQDFEWENKIVINTPNPSMTEFTNLVAKHTNLSIVGAECQVALTREILRCSQFAAVNLYAKSIFGEDALANVSLERIAGNTLVGTVRLRSRTQGIALSLGDKVSHLQKSH